MRKQEARGQSFKVYTHTLAPHTIFGPGSYAISYGLRAFKKMTGTTNFKHHKKCSFSFGRISLSVVQRKRAVFRNKL